eukprot:COSAG06_NODE_3040_length_5924_cov_41.632446_6_plen_89_part_00
MPSRYSRIVESDRVSLDCLFGALHDMSSIAVNRKSPLDLLTESLSASVHQCYYHHSHLNLSEQQRCNLLLGPPLELASLTSCTCDAAV